MPIVYRPPAVHVCRRPGIWASFFNRPGTVWACNHCHARYELNVAGNWIQSAKGI